MDTNDNLGLGKESAEGVRRNSNNTNGARGTVPPSGGGGQQLKPKIKKGSLTRASKRDITKRILMDESDAVDVLQESLKGFYAYDHDSFSWYEFTVTHWEKLNTSEKIDGELFRLLKIGVGDLSFKQHYQDAVKKTLTNVPLLKLPKPNKSKLPFKNGLLDLNTKQFEPVTAANAQTWCYPVDYDPNADCPRIKAWLDWCMNGNEEMVELLCAAAAAVLHGNYELQRYFHLLGPGGTGKSTFVKLIRALVGEQNTADTSFKNLDKNRFAPAVLCDKRLAVLSDSDRYVGSGSIIKQLSGEDSLPYEIKGVQQTGSFKFTGIAIMVSNEAMQITDHSDGIFRRRVTIPFTRKVSEEEKDEWSMRGGEEAVLHSELSGFFNLILRYSTTEIRAIITRPPQITLDANIDAMAASNVMVEWLRENIEQSPHDKTQIGDGREIREPGKETRYEYSNDWLYPNHLLYCQRAKKQPVALQRFRETLVSLCGILGWKVRKSRQGKGIFVHGLRINPECKEPEHGARHNSNGEHQDESKPF